LVRRRFEGRIFRPDRLDLRRKGLRGWRGERNRLVSRLGRLLWAEGMALRGRQVYMPQESLSRGVF
jgi:hypothetical protein